MQNVLELNLFLELMKAEIKVKWSEMERLAKYSSS